LRKVPGRVERPIFWAAGSLNGEKSPAIDVVVRKDVCKKTYNRGQIGKRKSVDKNL